MQHSQQKMLSTGVNGKAVVRIRTPQANDVLCGRGGGINSHPGNKAFRTWVHERKESYNLASNKHEKAKVSVEVIERVKSQNPPGRFLAREENANFGSGGMPGVTGYWIEIDLNKAIAKTSQALREGAPKIRAEHGVDEVRHVHTETGEETPRSSTRRKRSLSGGHEGEYMPYAPVVLENVTQQRVTRAVQAVQSMPRGTLNGQFPEIRLMPNDAARALETAAKSVASISTGAHHSSAQPSTGTPPPVKPAPKTITQKLFGSQIAANNMAIAAQKGALGAKPGPVSATAPAQQQPALHHPAMNLDIDTLMLGPDLSASLNFSSDATPPLIPAPCDEPRLRESLMGFKLDPSIFDVTFLDSGMGSPPSFLKEFRRSHSLATSDVPGGEALDNDEDFGDTFADDLFDIGVSAESNPCTSAVLRGTSFGSLGLSNGNNHNNNHDNNNVLVRKGSNSNTSNPNANNNGQQRQPTVQRLKSTSSNVSNMSTFSNLSNLSGGSPLSRRLFGSVTKAATPMNTEINSSA